MITEKEVEKCIDYLRDSAEEYAKWRSAERYYEQKLKRIESLEFMEQTTGAVEARRMAARASEEYGKCIEDHREAQYNAELIAARREAAKLKISFYQTQVKASIGGF